MGAAELVTEMTMPLISTAFLTHGFVYTPILSGFVFEALALVAIYHVPVDTCMVQYEERPLVNTQRNRYSTQTSTNGVRGGKLRYIADVWRDGSIMTDPNVVILLGCFALVKVGRQMLEMLVQYISSRYGWTFAQVSSS